MRRIPAFLQIILLAIALTLTLSVICDYFKVYIPGVACLIPESRRPAPASPPPIIPPIFKDEVVIR